MKYIFTQNLFVMLIFRRNHKIKQFIHQDSILKIMHYIKKLNESMNYHTTAINDKAICGIQILYSYTYGILIYHMCCSPHM